ncbi:hypothetical protein GCM10009544_08480 [Streptomyces stramineus]|uniref:Uncharacterized protein n=1 Tax=Streptomyces stramineus TaxID=173861 RepID=A0ABN0ZI76_9ACTN
MDTLTPGGAGLCPRDGAPQCGPQKRRTTMLRGGGSLAHGGQLDYSSAPFTRARWDRKV